MAPYDVPYPAHDMILRFMGMNFSAITAGSAMIPSKIGAGESKPVFQDVSGSAPPEVPASKTPEKDKAMWEGAFASLFCARGYSLNSWCCVCGISAYYNAGSAALVLILISLAIALFIFCRVRRNRLRLPAGRDESRGEEEIPLRSGMGGREEEDEDVFRKRKGKERAVDERGQEETIFDVGESDDEEGYKSADDEEGRH